MEISDILKNKSEQRFTSDQKLAWWGPGEWVEELDTLVWEYKGTRCMAYRVVKDDNCPIAFGGHFCGYVLVPQDHPWRDQDKVDIDANVHGGITFSEGNENGYLVGFDCAHSGDLIPAMPKILKISQQNMKVNHPDLWKSMENVRAMCKSMGSFNIYRNIHYVRSKCEALVDEMLEAACVKN